MPGSCCSPVRCRVPFLPVPCGHNLKELGSEPMVTVLTPGTGSELRSKVCSLIYPDSPYPYARDWEVGLSQDTIPLSESGDEELCPLRGKQSLQETPHRVFLLAHDTSRGHGSWLPGSGQVPLPQLLVLTSLPPLSVMSDSLWPEVPHWFSPNSGR